MNIFSHISSSKNGKYHPKKHVSPPTLSMQGSRSVPLKKNWKRWDQSSINSSMSTSRINLTSQSCSARSCRVLMRTIQCYRLESISRCTSPVITAGRWTLMWCDVMWLYFCRETCLIWYCRGLVGALIIQVPVSWISSQPRQDPYFVQIPVPRTLLRLRFHEP